MSKQALRFEVVVEPNAHGGFDVRSPQVPGVGASGDTRAVAVHKFVSNLLRNQSLDTLAQELDVDLEASERDNLARQLDHMRAQNRRLSYQVQIVTESLQDLDPVGPTIGKQIWLRATMLAMGRDLGLLSYSATLEAAREFLREQGITEDFTDDFLSAPGAPTPGEES